MEAALVFLGIFAASALRFVWYVAIAVLLYKILQELRRRPA